jgi:hypothetical protein
VYGRASGTYVEYTDGVPVIEQDKTGAPGLYQSVSVYGNSSSIILTHMRSASDSIDGEMPLRSLRYHCASRAATALIPPPKDADSSKIRL